MSLKNLYSKIFHCGSSAYSFAWRIGFGITQYEKQTAYLLFNIGQNVKVTKGL